MGQVIRFEDRAVARLRERLGLVEEANQDLIAFARGHSGAVASIHQAALSAVEASSVPDLMELVTQGWPRLLGIDAAAVALVVGGHGFRADRDSIERVDAAFVHRMLRSVSAVEVRSVEAGHPLFGQPTAMAIRAEALIRIDAPSPFPVGLLALGQRDSLEIGTSHGSELLLFLGSIVAAALRRLVATAG